jgi:hypothetical protein
MKWLITFAICLATIVAPADAKPFLCAKSPEAKWGCFWTKGVVNDSADAGDVISLQENGGYILDEEPDSLHKLIGEGSTYIVGDYLFCPFSPRLHEPSGLENLDWWYYGCVEDFKNTTVIRMVDIHASPEALEKRVCALVDCSRPGFSAFRKSEKPQ